MALADILVVDDDELYQRSLARALGSDLRVRYAADVLSGLALASELQPSVVVLDLLVGDRWGMDYVEQFRKASPWAEIVISTAVAVDDKIMSQADDFDVALLSKGDYQELSMWIRKASFLASDPTVPDDLSLEYR